MNTIDEQIEILQAYKAGKTIQVYQGETKDGKPLWIDCANKYSDRVNELACLRFDEQTYRIKQEPKIRPYKNAEEFLKAQKEHGPYICSLRNREFYYLPYAINSLGITNERIGNVRYTDTMKVYVWQDGSPCGVEEE